MARVPPPASSKRTPRGSRTGEEELRFRPSARLQRYLGRELISDPNLAIIEFVKNGYDAGASLVVIDFVLTGSETYLVVADDGVGMDYAAFQENWMHPGYSAKADDAPAAARQRAAPATAAGRRLEKRTPVGEKGLGRLAAGRLGEVMDIYTRPVYADPWLHVHIEWDAFDDMSKHMDEIVIPHDYVEELPDEFRETQVGTVVVIRDLQLDWAGKLRGRPTLGRSTTRLGRLKEDLELLLRPLDMTSPDFQVELRSDAVSEEIQLGRISPSTALNEAPYRYEFEFRLDRVWQPYGKEDTAPKSTGRREFKRKELEDLYSGPLARSPRQGGADGTPVTLMCGPFSGTFLYTPPPRRERAKQEDVVGHGVLLYRDQVLVEPYGLDENDWIGVEARKAQRQGHALIQPSTFWGEVRIDRKHNPALRDMADRQGLLENEASEEFLAHLRNEFRLFDETVGAELETRWRTREEKAAEAAKEQIRAVTLRTKSFAHHLRQPLMGMGGELTDGTPRRRPRDSKGPPRSDAI